MVCVMLWIREEGDDLSACRRVGLRTYRCEMPGAGRTELQLSLVRVVCPIGIGNMAAARGRPAPIAVDSPDDVANRELQIGAGRSLPSMCQVARSVTGALFTARTRGRGDNL